MSKDLNNDKNQLYPVFLKLQDLKVLLVGGGNVGFEKLSSILGNAPGTEITVVAPSIRDELKKLAAAHSRCILIERAFEDSDLEGQQVLLLATDNPVLHGEIKKLATAKGILVNVADTPALCDFYLGSIVQKGSLKIAISTNGKSPTIAKRIKELIAGLLPDEIDELLDNMQAIRNEMSGDFQDKVRQLNDLTARMVHENNSVKTNLPVHEK